MFGIGDFARHGRVSVRMLRHYDALGLLVPARVDPVSGYRFYEAGQLSRLNRIVALKGLGFTLEQVHAILEEQVSGEQLRGMLRLRQAELETQIAGDVGRLAQVEARLRLIENEDALVEEVRVERVPAIRVAELTATAAGFEPASIGPVITPLFMDLRERVRRAGLLLAGPELAHYTPHEVDDGIVVHAAVPVVARLHEVEGLDIVDLPAIDRAATIIHRGPMPAVMSTLQELARWIESNGHRPAGYNREVYLETPVDPERWVTELQEPLITS